jgi:hypothetical protein
MSFGHISFTGKVHFPMGEVSGKFSILKNYLVKARKRNRIEATQYHIPPSKAE